MVKYIFYHISVLPSDKTGKTPAYIPRESQLVTVYNLDHKHQ